MKKVISLLLVLSVVFCSFAFSVSAADAGNSITLPLIYDSATSQLKYNVALRCIGDHVTTEKRNPLTEPALDGADPFNGQGVIDISYTDDEIAEYATLCAEHADVIYTKPGSSSDATPDYVIYYDMEKFGYPSRNNGELRVVDENFFEFSVVANSKYDQHFVVKANGKIISPNAQTGKYVLPMTYSYNIEIEDLSLRTINIHFSGTGTQKGYNLYGSVERPTANTIFQRQNGVYGQDYYVVLLAINGYRQSIRPSKTSTGIAALEFLSGVNFYASYGVGSLLPPLDATKYTESVGYVYEDRSNGDFKYYIQYDSDELLDKTNSDLTFCGIVYKIKGEAMSAKYTNGLGRAVPVTDIEPTVTGVKEDKKANFFQRLKDIIRLIINFFKNLY